MRPIDGWVEDRETDGASSLCIMIMSISFPTVSDGCFWEAWFLTVIGLDSIVSVGINKH